MSLVLATAPAAEPVSLPEVKAFLRVAVVDDDALITSLITAARQELDGADGWLGRCLITQTWDLILDAFPGAWWDVARDECTNAIAVPLPPLLAVTSLTYVDGAGATQTLAPADYIVDAKSEPGRIVPAYGGTWPTTREVPNAVTVRFQAGYGTAGTNVPTPIVVAIKALVLDMYGNPSELARKRHADVDLEYRRSGAHFPPHVRRLLTPFKVWA